MTTSESQSPGRMPWEEYERRVLLWVSAMLTLRGGPVPQHLKDEAFALLGAYDDDVLHVLTHPPRVCPRCGALHRHPLGGTCSDCIAAEAEEKRRAAVRAEIEAEVRAEVMRAQKGGAT